MERIFTNVFYRVIFFFLTGSAVISCYSSHKYVGVEDGWDLLGTHKVDFIHDKDELIVNNGTRYTALRFRIEDRDVHISDMNIFFRNGDKLQPAIDDNLSANTDSRVIDLDRDGRELNRIEFKYRTVGNILKGRAKVFIYGKRLDRDKY